MSAEQQKCCAVQQPPLMDFLLTLKKKKNRMTLLQCPNPGPAHILSAFLLDVNVELPTEMAGLNLARGRAGVCLPLYCTSKQLTQRVSIRVAVQPFGTNKL